MYRKAQILMGDFMASILVFALIVIVSLSVWFLAENRAQIQNTMSENEVQAHYLMNLLMGNGEPTHWQRVNATQHMGLLDAGGQLSMEKVNFFVNKSYKDMKIDMGIQKDFFIRVRNSTGKIFSMGAVFPDEIAVSLVRPLTQNNESIFLEVYVYG